MSEQELIMFVEEDGTSIECGQCNWRVSRTFWMAESREKAVEELKELHEEEFGDRKGLCGDCMAELIAEGGYQLAKP